MALKTSESFIRFVSMGAVGAHRAVEVLNAHGHDARELERYATCNKIWQRKIKRLRLPDLFCLRCGQRFEVRAKSTLEIKMSDSPAVPGREWDAGLRDEDIALFVRCDGGGEIPVADEHVQGFTIGDLRQSVGSSKLGPPKSASEGAERDRTWPSIVPATSGEVAEVSGERLTVRLDSGRRQSYGLLRRGNGARLNVYVEPGERFVGETEILAGVPASRAGLRCAGRTWNSSTDLSSPDILTRYAAIKATGLLGEQRPDQLQSLAETEDDPRVRLEAIGSLLRLEQRHAGAMLLASFDLPAREDLRMETVLIASETRNQFARSALKEMLTRSATAEDEELRAAIIWGLGAFGQKDFDAVRRFLNDPSDLVASHAAVSLGRPLDAATRTALLALLSGDDHRAAAGSAWVLLQDSAEVVPLLIELAEHDPQARGWALSVLGRRPESEVRPLLEGNSMLTPLLISWWVSAPDRNWPVTLGGAQTLRDVARQSVTQSI